MPVIRLSQAPYDFWRNPAFVRGGVLPQDSKSKLYLLPIDSDYKTYIDFGGRRDPSDPTILETALREWKEESLDLFNYSVKQLYELDPLIAYNHEAILLLIPINVNPDQLREEFLYRVQNGYRQHIPIEVNDVHWLSEDHLKNLVQGERTPIYSRTKDILQQFYPQEHAIFISED